jgi:hypothetical protein
MHSCVDTDDAGRLFVIGLGGSFNPVHEGHVAMMVRAKEVLEQLAPGSSTVCGFLAVALDSHVARKGVAMKGGKFFSVFLSDSVQGSIG